MVETSIYFTICLLLLRAAAQFNLYPPIDPDKLATAYNITTDCLASLNQTLPECDPTLFGMVSDLDMFWWENDNITDLCIGNCSDAATMWALDVQSACDGEYFSAYGKLIPADSVAGSTDDSWCLVESQNWVGSDIFQVDCDANPSDTSCTGDGTGIDPASQRIANLYTDDTLCDDCFIKILYQRVTSPYLADSDHSDYLVDQLQDIGDVCNTSIPDITVRALQTYPAAPPISSIAFTTTSTLAAPTSTGCEGQTISNSNKRSLQIHGRIMGERDVDATSTCDLLSNKYGLTTGDLQGISGSTDCTISNALCFPASCKLMQVPNGATCDTLASSIPGNHTTIQFLTWNPNIMGLCDNPTVGQYVCSAAPGVNGTYTLSPPPLGTDADAGNQQRGGPGGVVTPTTTISLGPSTPVPAPGPTQNGVSTLCNAWETPANGFGCVDFALLNGISTSQLYEWNPILGPTGEHCGDEFQFNEYYCVGVVQENGGVVATASASPTTTIAITAPGPTQTGIISICNKYAEALDGIGCYDFATQNGITPAQLYAWNNVLGPNGENCGSSFFGQEWYCVGVSENGSS
ncbi:hypothetical protein MMC22_009585 [Lobaria immixta]|nr:hypothetical protein [Lobaria immixta]